MPAILPTLLSPLATLLSGSRPASRKLQILIFHRVLDQKDPLQPSEPSTAEFEWQVALLARHFRLLPLAEAAARLRDDTLPPRAACITFDDGYTDNLTLAQPILEKYGAPATVFVATGFLDGGIMFNDAVLECIRQYRGDSLSLDSIGAEGELPMAGSDQRRASFRTVIGLLKYLPEQERADKVAALVAATGTRLPDGLMMSTAQLRELNARGVVIGAHTVNHPILRNLDDDSARSEIERSKAFLEQVLQQPVDLFAYPNGVPGQDYGERDAALLQGLGFSAAVSTAAGCSDREVSPFELRRFTPWDKTPERYYLRLLKNYL